MLSIGRVGPANAGYYQSAVVAGAEDYYAGDGDAPGVWVGRADLVGAVAGRLATAVDAKLLLEAKSAPDGTLLGKTTVSERSVTAFDLTSSVPKSVSVLQALGDVRVAAEIEAAHAVAVEEAIKSMSPRIAFTRTGRAGAAVVDAEEVFGIRYRHRTSRALDPQLHDHVLIANAVRTVSDGEWRTLDARGLFREAKAAGTVFQTHLRAETKRRLGVRFNVVDENGQADIVGIDEALLVEFSTRSHDIETALAEWTTDFIGREGRSPSGAEVGKAHKTIVLATRPGKPDGAGLSTDTLRQAWRRRADTIVDVDRMLAETLGNPPSPAVIVRPDIEVVLAAVELKHAEWSESQLIEQIAMRVAGPDPSTIATTIDGVRVEAMASAGVVDLTAPAETGDMVRASDGRPVHLPPSAVRCTTSRHVLREGDVIEWAQAPVAEGHRGVSFEAQSVAGLDDSQIAAVSEMLTNPRPVMTDCRSGRFGQDPDARRRSRLWTEQGVSVFGAAPSAAAAGELREGAGVASDTLHKLVYEHSTKHHTGHGLPGAKWTSRRARWSSSMRPAWSTHG
ncbi:MAG: MobF family relaxase [Ilumatobacteraceae bacterium]